MSLWSAKNLGSAENWRPQKNDARTTVYRAFSNSCGDVIVKHFMLPGSASQLRFWLRSRKLRRFYQEVSVPVAPLIAVSSDRSKKLGECVYRVVKGVDLRGLKSDDLVQAEWGSLFSAIGQRVNQLHRSGWVHGDLKFGNVVFDREAGDSMSGVSFIDLEGVSKPVFNPQPKKSRDIARFILNALEAQCGVDVLAQFWLSATHGYTKTEISAFRKYTLRWLRALSLRHKNKYGKSVDVSQCDFLYESRLG
ncbi:hypothetical protein NBRC116494_29820 [Aurantivibrio plasticivorans]